MRSHAERLLLSEGVAITPTFDEKARQRFKQDTPGAVAYSGTCPLGRTFGTLAVKGRIGVTDHTPGGHELPGSDARRAEIDRANAVEQRNAAAIDRLLGSAKGKALFDQEVVVQGRFDGRIVFRNFQLYQLALILLVLRDIDDGFVQIGSGTTRGNGWVGVAVRRIVIESRRGRAEPGTLCGAGAVDAGLDQYNLFSGDLVALPDGIATGQRLLWDQATITGATVDVLAEDLVAGPWESFLEQAKRVKKWEA
jgi:CRISPR/Cas system CSM-associated protein Csm3 (group 7 of RAMP superfamily)